MTSTALITRDHNGMAYTFRKDGWFNMTKAAKHFSRRLDHFMAAPDTAMYVEALKANSPDSGEYLVTQRGRHGGTWAHPKLAVFFARWLDVRFSVWCDAVIEDILKGAAEVTIVKLQESAVMALPQDFEAPLEALLASLKQASALKAEKAPLEALRVSRWGGGHQGTRWAASVPHCLVGLGSSP